MKKKKLKKELKIYKEKVKRQEKIINKFSIEHIKEIYMDMVETVNIVINENDLYDIDMYYKNIYIIFGLVELIDIMSKNSIIKEVPKEVLESIDVIRQNKEFKQFIQHVKADESTTRDIIINVMDMFCCLYFFYNKYISEDPEDIDYGYHIDSLYKILAYTLSSGFKSDYVYNILCMFNIDNFKDFVDSDCISISPAIQTDISEIFDTCKEIEKIHKIKLFNYYE